MTIEGKVVLITGASEGIGKSIALLLSKKGAKVALAARSKDKLDNLAAELNDAFAVQVDMVDENAVTATISAELRQQGYQVCLLYRAARATFCTLLAQKQFVY